MADPFNLDDESAAYELPEDYFSRPSSTYLDLGGFTYTPEETAAVMPTSDELAFSNLNLGGFDYVPEETSPIMPTSSESGTSDWQSKIKSIAESLGLTKKGDGSYDWNKIIGLGAAGLTTYDTLNQSERPVKTTAQLLAGMPSNAPSGLSPQVLAAMQSPMRAGNQIQGQYAADMPSTIRGGLRGYADGGEVEGPLSRTFDSSAEQGFVGGGEGGGQDDMVDARLSPGEYVFDAESVSMLGDGDNAAGARKLDELRMAMREHKRSASPDEIAPKSLGPLSYLNGGQNG